MKTITLYTFNELNPAAQEKATERYAWDALIGVDIAKEVLSNENYHFEFLEDGTRIQIIEG
jgi:hypothetical protein